LRTIPEAQRRGYAQEVVQTALHAVQMRGFWPRYVVEKNNVPSIRLAEGLRPCLHFEHYLNMTE
jgi:ribosomal protein S18 acetylase RimI-like enzyme